MGAWGQGQGNGNKGTQGNYLEGLMLKLKLQYFGHLIGTANSLEKSLEGRRRREHQRMRWLAGITNAMDMNLGKLGDSEGQGGLARCSPWGHQELDTIEWLNKCSMSWWWWRLHECIYLSKHIKLYTSSEGILSYVNEASKLTSKILCIF